MSNLSNLFSHQHWLSYDYVRNIIDRLDEVHSVSGGWRCRCPAHADENPSLDVGIGDNGSVLFICRSQHCSAESIMARIGLEVKDMFPPSSREAYKKTTRLANQTPTTTPTPTPTPASKPAKRGRRKKTIEELEQSGRLITDRVLMEEVDSWVYEDENNKPLYRVVRFEDKLGHKEYYQQHPVGRTLDTKTNTYSTIWSPGVQGIRNVPYKLPQILAHSPEEPLFIVAGEKCATALWDRFNLLATTNSGGEGKFGLMDVATMKAAFSGRYVVIIPDNDEPGYEHANQIAKTLGPSLSKKEIVSKGPEGETIREVVYELEYQIAARIKIVFLHDLRERKEDIYDWILKYNHTIDDLHALIDAAPDFPSTTNLDEWNAWFKHVENNFQQRRMAELRIAKQQEQIDKQRIEGADDLDAQARYYDELATKQAKQAEQAEAAKNTRRGECLQGAAPNPSIPNDPNIPIEPPSLSTPIGPPSPDDSIPLLGAASSGGGPTIDLEILQTNVRAAKSEIHKRLINRDAMPIVTLNEAEDATPIEKIEYALMALSGSFPAVFSYRDRLSEISFVPGRPRPMIKELTYHQVMMYLSSAINFLKVVRGESGEGQYIPIVWAPGDFTNMVMDYPDKERFGIRVLEGISVTPVFSANGNFSQKVGYDATTRMFCFFMREYLGIPLFGVRRAVYKPIVASEIGDPAKSIAKSAAEPIKPDDPVKPSDHTLEYIDQLILDRSMKFENLLKVISPSESLTEPRRVAEMCVDRILSVVSEVPFLAEHHKSMWIALILTLIARKIIRGNIPNWAIDSNQPGSGKGLLIDIACWIAFGQVYPKQGYNTEVEIEKRFATTVLADEPIVIFDNLTSEIRSPLVEMVTTSGRFRSRVLGSNKREAVIDEEWKSVICFTGNNLRLGSDSRRRVQHIRIETNTDRPAERRFAIEDLESYVRDLHPILFCCAASILNLYIKFGSRTNLDLKPYGSFQQWSNLIRNAVVWAGLPDPNDYNPGGNGNGGGENGYSADSSYHAPTDYRSEAIETLINLLPAFYSTDETSIRVSGLKIEVERRFDAWKAETSKFSMGGGGPGFGTGISAQYLSSIDPDIEHDYHEALDMAGAVEILAAGGAKRFKDISTISIGAAFSRIQKQRVRGRWLESCPPDSQGYKRWKVAREEIIEPIELNESSESSESSKSSESSENIDLDAEGQT